MRSTHKQDLALFDAYQRQVAACDTAIETHLARLIAALTTPSTALPPSAPATEAARE